MKRRIQPLWVAGVGPRWVLEGFPVRAIAKASGWSDTDADALDRYRADLVKQLVELARPV